ncbi:MAG: phosphoribosylglycinamide formyltransferase, partial [Ignavibacterium sp.]
PIYNVGDKEDSLSFEEIKSRFDEIGIDLIVLAGFLKLIPANFVNSYRNKIINIHPALLPSYGGSGMFGMNVHKAVFNASAQVSGVSIHFVDENYDTGKIIAQRCVDISDIQSPEELAERVLKIEHQLLPEVIEKFALGKVFVDKSRVRILK